MRGFNIGETIISPTVSQTERSTYNLIVHASSTRTTTSADDKFVVWGKGQAENRYLDIDEEVVGGFH